MLKHGHCRRYLACSTFGDMAYADLGPQNRNLKVEWPFFFHAQPIMLPHQRLADVDLLGFPRSLSHLPIAFLGGAAVVTPRCFVINDPKLALRDE